MYLQVKIYLNPNENAIKELLSYETTFKMEVKRIFETFIKENKIYEYPYKLVSNNISYNSKCLALLTAKEMYKKKEQNIPYRYSYSSIWNNSSYEINENVLKLELGIERNKEKLIIPIYFHEQPMNRIISGKAMNMKIINRKGKWYANIYIECKPSSKNSKKIMGIDIGVKVPAVCATEKNKICFFGNGRELRYIQRKFKSHIKEMQRNKQYKKLRAYEHKLSHVLNYYDHKISKEIIDYAIANDIGFIKMENLTRINLKFNTYHNPNIYLWSYRRLQEYIDYKAKLNGIKVIYINPYNTSKTCPICGQINPANDRNYECSCGFHGHRDAVAAMNILNAL
ncbi:MAG: transposase [Erysipelotrichaceae bacterium]